MFSAAKSSKVMPDTRQGVPSRQNKTGGGMRRRKRRMRVRKRVRRVMGKKWEDVDEDKEGGGEVRR